MVSPASAELIKCMPPHIDNTNLLARFRSLFFSCKHSYLTSHRDDCIIEKVVGHAGPENSFRRALMTLS